MNLRPQGVALLIMLRLSMHPASAFDFHQPVHPPRAVALIAPGGSALRAPPSSRPALIQCIEDGMEWARVEVRRSRDGHHFLAPDGVPAPRDHGQPAAIRELDAVTVRHLDPGAAFARRYRGEPYLDLGEALRLIRDRLNLVLDCRDVDFPTLLQEIRHAGRQRQVLLHIPAAHVATARTQAGPEFALRAVWNPSQAPSEWHRAVPVDAVEIPAHDARADVIRDFHALGVQVQVTLATPDPRPEDWDRLLACGADALETTVPEEFLAHTLRLRLPHQKWPVLVSLHRGASRYAPENTLPAFAKAARLHADFVEFDVRTSRDGGLFLLHDRTLDRTSSGHGPISGLDSEAVALLDAGSWFGPDFHGEPLPTLDRFLAAMPRHLWLYLDAKDVAPERLVQSLSHHGWTDRTVVYQSEEYLQRLRQLEPALRRLAPLRRAADLPHLADSLQPHAVDAAWGILSRELIAACHARGIRVFSDALGENESIDRYREAMAWGIDLIQTDHPLRVYRAFEHAAAPAPSAPKP